MKIYHPVLTSPRYEKKMISYLRKQASKQARTISRLEASVEMLRKQMQASAPRK